VAPKEVVMNAVVALPDGGFAATSTQTRDVWEWHAASGWQRIPGSEDTAPNGLEISKDGRWLYIAGWAEEKLTRLSRGQTPVKKDVVKLGFRPDNVRLSADGSVILAAGHGNVQTPRDFLKETSNVARIDPQTLDVKRIFQHPHIEGFGGSTTAITIGKEMWLGTYRGEMIAYLPAPQ
jgi:sugar lactone lactonase YvrE